MDRVKLVGYWNGSSTSPEITFNTPTDIEDTRKLVIIYLEPVYQAPKVDKEVKGLSKKTKNLAKSLDKALKALK